MNKIIGVFALSMFMALQSFTSGTDNKIEFKQENINKIAKVAAKENKLLFVYIGVNSCHTCHDLEKTLSNEGVAAFYNENFINLKLDGENTMNIMRANSWGVSQVPAMVFLDDDKNVVHIIEGFQSPENMLTQGKLAIEQSKK